MEERFKAPPTRSTAVVMLVVAGIVTELVYLLVFGRAFPLDQYVAIPMLDLGKLTQYSLSGGITYLGAMLTLFVLYVGAASLARLAVGDHRAVVVVLGFAALFAITMGWVYPTGSLDIFAYVFQGRVLAHYHANPFIVAPVDFPNDPMFPYLAWPHEPSPYGPLWVILGAGAALVYQDNLLLLGTIVFKALVIASYLLTAWIVYLILKRRQMEGAAAGTLLFAWNPLVIYETATNGHNDAVMAFLAILALYLMVERRVRLSLPVLMASAMIKFVTVVLFPVYLLSWLRQHDEWRRRTGDAIVGLCIAALLVVVLYAPFWIGLDTVGALKRGNLFTASLSAWLYHWLNASGNPWAGQLVWWSSIVLFAIVVLLRLVFVRGEVRDAIAASFDILFAYLMVATQWFQPWYLVTLIGFAAALDEPPRRRLALIFSACACLNYFVFSYLWAWYPTELGLVQVQGIAALATFGPPLVCLVWMAGSKILGSRSGREGKAEPTSNGDPT